MSRSDHAPETERRREPRGGLLRPLLDVLYRAVRWAADHARGFYGAVGLFLVLGFGVAALALGGFALLAEAVAGGTTQQLDQAVVDWARTHRSPALDTLALIGAGLGSGVATWIALGAGTLFFWFSRHHWSAAVLWIALLGGRLLNTELKALFDRPRPDPVDWNFTVFGQPVSFPGNASFPSGHAVTSVIIFGTLAYLIMRLEPTRAQRRWTLAVAALAILLIGLSRVYLGVHYPSDVIAGYLTGFIWSTFAVFSIEVLRYAHGRWRGAEPEEADLGQGVRPVRDAVAGD